jgi:hypothetical protein
LGQFGEPSGWIFTICQAEISWFWGIYLANHSQKNEPSASDARKMLPCCDETKDQPHIHEAIPGRLVKKKYSQLMDIPLSTISLIYNQQW